MSEKIREALAKLDIDNEDHWTSEGLPRLDVMKDLVGEPVSRADITAAAKGFTRKTPNLETEKPEMTGEGEQVDAQPAQEATQDAPAAPTEEAEQDQAEDEPVEEGSDEAVEAELEAARAELNEAQRRFAAAQEAMDVVITRRAAEAAKRTTAHDIKAYQRSQFEQRQRAAARQRLMAEAAALTDKQV